MLTVWRSITPRFYAEFGQRPFWKSLAYLVCLLMYYEVLRFAVFYWEYQDTVASIRSDECVKSMVNGFPKDLQIHLRQKRFYFSRKTPIVLELPQCLQDGIGLISSYMSHGALTPEEIWEMVAPFVILVEKDKDIQHALGYLTTNRVIANTPAGRNALLDPNRVYYDQRDDLHAEREEGEEYDDEDDSIEAVFLVVSRRQALLLEMIPVGHIFQSFLRVASVVRDGADAEEREVDENVPVKLDKTILQNSIRVFKRRIQEETWLLPFLDAMLAGLLIVGGYLVGLMSSIELLITSTILFVAVRQGRFGASFRFWNVKRHFDRSRESLHVTEEDLEQVQSMLSETYAREIDERPGEFFEDLPDLFFSGISIHTATVGLFVDAFYPYPVLQTVGVGAIVHLVFTAFMVRYFALPGFFMEKYMRRILQARGRQRERVQASRATSTQNPIRVASSPSAAQEMQRRIQQLAAESQWRQLLHDQQKIASVLRSTSMSLPTKLSTVISLMENIRASVFLNQIHTLHVWSKLNAGADPKGGPGFCYGLSTATGAWVLLSWYDHPCSEEGINALCAYPGQVYIADRPQDDDVPPSMLPSREELGELHRQLDTVKRTFEGMTHLRHRTSRGVRVTV